MREAHRGNGTLDALSGRTIGQHIVKEKLGSGGMAEVYKALHPRLNTHRAIKVIRPEFSGSEDFQARFESEAQLVAGLRHPNIAQIHDFGVEDDLYYMVMEFVEGRDLKSLMDAEAIGTDRAIDVMIQVARGLQEAHRRGVLHRDLKPENIMVTPDGLAVLIIFGIALLGLGLERMQASANVEASIGAAVAGACRSRSAQAQPGPGPFRAGRETLQTGHPGQPARACH